MQTHLAIEPAPLPLHATGFLEIDTKAIAHNYRVLQSMMSQTVCAAVLKADAYGFGIKAVAPLLMNQGCRSFFVAHLEEGLFLRSLLKEPRIYILSGFLPESEDLYIENSLIPILNDFEMVESWTKQAQKRQQKLPCVLHFDTGMRRSGFDPTDLRKLCESLDSLKALDVQFVMSHLTSSHDLSHPMNKQQKALFDNLRNYLPKAKASLADTGGIYLGASYHYDVARPGKGLFGLFESPKETVSLRPCLKLLGRILQIRTAHKGESVGYGASYALTRESKLANLGVGFADGYDRRLSNNAYVNIQGHKAPVVGRISMDYTVVDVTDIPESLCYVGGWAELVNETLTLDILAHSIGTISRELSTGFGQRLYRVYR